MPNRDLRESALTSKTLARLSHGAERFFFRLTLVADDFGRFEADPMVLAARCFPAMLDKVKPSHVRVWLEELHRADLVTLYGLGDKTYGEFKTWMKHQRQRAKFSKYPSSADADICRHVSSYARKSPASASEEPVVTEEPVVPENTEDTECRTRAVSPASAGNRPPTSSAPTNGFQVPTSITAALGRAPHFGVDARITTPAYWLAEIRANPGLDCAAEVLKAEAWITANPTRAPRKDLARFLHTWLGRAEREG